MQKKDIIPYSTTRNSERDTKCTKRELSKSTREKSRQNLLPYKVDPINSNPSQVAKSAELLDLVRGAQGQGSQRMKSSN